ncbi:hypothetical protein C92 [Sulfolobus turreted icosahedral virus 1]|uniref:Uncharacterized protein n=1 Tax=Sulfolobus turreted icosahedral virus 1 TaxID=269145 RepID=Q6Q0L7_9VIRU|nr:pyramid forming protein [Sulfolobus turreted icosahedral virus 1]AAS89074.1 hypothetical protein C92 [Sulfolobus turreted icosahedral virus 1]
MLAEIALEGFLAAIGAISAVFIIAEAAHLYNEKIRNQSFQNAIDAMAKSTVVATESIKDTTVTGINALVNMDTLRDVNDLAKSKSQNQPAQK